MARTEQLDSPRIQAGLPGSISLTVYTDGALATITGTPTCAVVDAAGNAVASGNASAASGVLTFTLTAAQNAKPNVYTATWVATVGAVPMTFTSTHESRGALLFTLAEARAWDNGAIGDAAVYPDDLVLRGRDTVTDAFEDRTNRAFGTRYVREIYDGPGSQELDSRRLFVTAVRSVNERAAGTQTWTAYTAAQLLDVLAYPDGRLIRESLGYFTRGLRNVAVELEYGIQPIPGELRSAGLELLRYNLVESDMDPRATFLQNEAGQFNLAVAGRGDSWFGVPGVDAVLNQPRYRRLPGVH